MTKTACPSRCICCKARSIDRLGVMRVNFGSTQKRVTVKTLDHILEVWRLPQDTPFTISVTPKGFIRHVDFTLPRSSAR